MFPLLLSEHVDQALCRSDEKQLTSRARWHTSRSWLVVSRCKSHTILGASVTLRTSFDFSSRRTRVLMARRSFQNSHMSISITLWLCIYREVHFYRYRYRCRYTRDLTLRYLDLRYQSAHMYSKRGSTKWPPPGPAGHFSKIKSCHSVI